MSMLENLFKPDTPTTLEKLAEAKFLGKEIDLKTVDAPLFEYGKSIPENASEKRLNLQEMDKSLMPGLDKMLAKLEEDFGCVTQENPFREGASFMPVSNGTWEGRRGDSNWQPNPEHVPVPKSKGESGGYNNPDNKAMGEILKKYDIEGVPFKDGHPDFSEVSKGEVKVDEFTPRREKNFQQADIKLAEQKGCSPEDVQKWRKGNGYTWHELEDMQTMQKVPHEVHANIPHEGGISAKKSEQPTLA
ncbi:HNH endonuclease [Azotobacter beijerinckii]|uniref:A nuclease of the HNH/ENDO VII superfamily with conserved WHH n=1 Tax=Azotobacter beijerinckii TaxID=170623 RepID=A0A1I4IBL9_9GAMM|nr:HNH endonuclease [Azotobacter beijerinckii]SFA79855.1 A nuclease of the HNH/ENDO VII superfamily with conserved WHH [Azotobacter beijerinckii]SFL51772.1 A nuclease of the HNH/ENDO VII superfamily with conserved WHH [Azotobacter beijerinckii]